MSTIKRYKTKGTVSINEFLPLISITHFLSVRVEVCGEQVGVSSLRLRTFKEKGTSCAGCGLEASYFAVQTNSRGSERVSWHVNLWGITPQGVHILFTHDHKVARSKGGADALHNTQTMCEKCNSKKGTLTMEQFQHKLKQPSKPQKPKFPMPYKLEGQRTKDWFDKLWFFIRLREAICR